MAPEDYLVLAEDLLKFDLADITNGLDDIAKSPRREGETAFPELARLKQPIIERKLVREAEEIRKAEAAERAANPEEYMSAKEFWASPEVRAIMNRSRPAPEVHKAEEPTNA